MPRANRYLLDQQVYHLTHRCHDRQFLLKFARDRDEYRYWLWEGARRFGVAILGYCLTSNHVHLVAVADAARRISEMMDLVEGAVAAQYHRRNWWTESIAVGSEQFVQAIRDRVEGRQQLQIDCHDDGDGRTVWAVREEATRYQASLASQKGL